MTTQTKAFIKERVLAGYVTSEIARALPRLRPGSVNAYASQVRATLTPQEKEEAKKAKSARHYTRVIADTSPGYISNAHRKIGMRIARLRIEKFMTVEDFCHRFDFGTRNTIRTMECGQYDFTLSEIVDLSKILGISVEKLATGSF